MRLLCYSLQYFIETVYCCHALVDYIVHTCSKLKRHFYCFKVISCITIERHRNSTPWFQLRTFSFTTQEYMNMYAILIVYINSVCVFTTHADNVHGANLLCKYAQQYDMLAFRGYHKIICCNNVTQN